MAGLIIGTHTVGDNAITLAKMAGGTDGQIITYDASGDPVAVGPGSDGDVLTSTGAGSPPAFEASATTNPQQIAKAWCNFEGDGAPTMRDYFNCSVTSGGSAGRYNVDIDTDMGGDGAVVGGVSDDIDAYGGNRGICVANRNTGGGVKVTTFTASTASEGDMSDISIICFGD